MVSEYYAEQLEKTKLHCELTRMQTTELINIHLKKQDKFKYKQLWEFPWDSENELEKRLSEMNKEDFEESYRQFLGLQ